MKTHYSLYENILNKNEAATFRMDMTLVCNGFKVYKKLLPNLTTRICWFVTESAMPVSPLELRSRK